MRWSLSSAVVGALPSYSTVSPTRLAVCLAALCRLSSQAVKDNTAPNARDRTRLALMWKAGNGRVFWNLGSARVSYFGLSGVYVRQARQVHNCVRAGSVLYLALNEAGRPARHAQGK